MIPMSEIAIGEIFEYNGSRYRVIGRTQERGITWCKTENLDEHHSADWNEESFVVSLVRPKLRWV